MTLKEKLDKLRAGSAERIPAPAREIMHRATDDLRASGILDDVAKVGDALPSFALANTSGETIESQNLLRQGALVLTVYRGVW